MSFAQSSLITTTAIRKQAAIKERSRAAEKLAAAHREYARAVARCQPSPSGSGNVDKIGGPPADVVQMGNRVVQASDAFAEAHGRAEEASAGLLEKRGRILDDAMSSVSRVLVAIRVVRVLRAIVRPSIFAMRSLLYTSKYLFCWSAQRRS